MLVEEDSRWLALDPNPVLRWLDGSRITRGQAFDMLGAKSKFVFTSKLRVNCTDVEKELQLSIDGLPLGMRLYWIAGAGGCGADDKDKFDKNYLAKVFLTVFPVTREMKWDFSHRCLTIKLNGYTVRIVEN